MIRNDLEKLQSYKNRLIQDALLTHGDIEPAGVGKTFDECFTIEGHELHFWFNSPDSKSTHLKKISMGSEDQTL